MKVDEAAVDGEGKVTAVQPKGNVHLRCTSVQQHLFEDASSVVGTNEFDLNARLVGEVLEEFLGQRGDVVGQDTQHAIVFSERGFEFAAVLGQEQVLTKAAAEAGAQQQGDHEEGPHAVASVT